MSVFAVVAAFALCQTPLPAGDPPKQEPPQEAPKPRGLVMQSGDWSIKFYGFLRIDIIHDDSRPNSILLPAVIRSEEDAANVAAHPGVAFARGKSDFEISPRLTRIGFDLNGPLIEELGAKASGKVEIDFYGNATSESRAEPRMRHAYAKLSWDTFSILAGQTGDVIAPLFPTVNNGIVMWGAGNLGDQRPMVLFDYHPKAGEGTVTSQLEIGVTGANDNANLDAAPGNAYFDGPASGMPTIQGRLAYKGPHFWVERKTWEPGVWGHYAREHFDTVAVGAEDNFTSTAFGADLTLPLHDMVDLRGEVWRGKNVDDVRGGIFQGISSVPGKAEEIPAAGGWAELVIKTSDWWTIIVGSSRDNPNNEHVPAPTTGTNGAQANYVHYIGNRFPLGNGLTIGADYLHWTTRWAGQLNDGTDNRVNIFIQWNY